jgi:hypothetical protein
MAGTGGTPPAGAGGTPAIPPSYVKLVVEAAPGYKSGHRAGFRQRGLTKPALVVTDVASTQL